MVDVKPSTSLISSHTVKKRLHDPSKSSTHNGSTESGGERGALDTWPVYSLSPAVSSQLRSINKRTEELSHDLNPSLSTKPKFLQQLEAFLEKEIRLLGCPLKGPNVLRLQAHRQVFDILIQDFKTYKPLLSSIKNEYDLYIKHQDELIRELLPLQTQIHHLKDENEKKIMMLKTEERKHDEGLREECKCLLAELSHMKSEQLSYEAQITKLQSELSILYEKYRNETDARKLLISDYNELKAKQNEEEEEEEDIIEKEDPTILKLKLVRAREDLRAANLRINGMLADYGDVVPRREFEMLETSFTTLEGEADSIKSQYATIIEEHNTLMVMYKDLQAQRDRSLNELARIKGTATPRPDWSRCAEFIDGGSEKWIEISEGRSSDELVDVLCAQIAGVDISELTTHGIFQGQGLSSEVPRYLRTEGHVTNRRMGRREMEELITGFWEFRMTKLSEQSREEINSLDKLLYEYCYTRNDGNEQLAIEDGYNLQDACTRFSHEVHVNIFTDIISGKLDEGVYDAWISTQVALMESFKKSADNKESLPLNKFEQTIQDVLSYKQESLIKLLVQCAVNTSSTQNGDINIIQLMSKDSNSQPSAFVTLILEQRREEAKQYATNISKILGEKEEVTLSEVTKAIQVLDPYKPEAEIHLLLSKFFTIPLGQVQDSNNITIPLDKLVKKIESSNITKAGGSRDSY